MSRSLENLQTQWDAHHAQWRDPQQVMGNWQQAAPPGPGIFQHRVKGDWWGLLDQLGVTLLVSREYEHLLMALTVAQGEPRVSWLALPHPSGLAVDPKTRRVWVACTRNPNQVLELQPARQYWDGLKGDTSGGFLMPVQTRFYAGSLYLHDLALIGGVLHGNAVGQNAVVRFEGNGEVKRVWWPRCIETATGPVFSPNHLQLNSIAAGKTLQESFFTASSDRLTRQRPGHANWRVDQQGVVFSGQTREVVCRGLTRPHSLRLHRGRLWVDNSGYGELGVVRGGGYEPVARLPGWTRGLCLLGDVALVGTSRVIPRFAQYAPGLSVEKSRCGLHAVCLKTGQVLASLFWLGGNQLFAIEAMPRRHTLGFPRATGHRSVTPQERDLYYAYKNQS